MKNENVLLSIIIPTKDRYSTLLKVLNILLLIKSTDFEVIIQDNSADVTCIKKYLLKKSDSRLRYFYSKEKLSQTENSNLALKNCSGKYVCFIGDDDCVTHQILDATYWMEAKAIDVLTFTIPNYLWPDLVSNKSDLGILKYTKPSGNFKLQNPKLELGKVLNRGGQNIKYLPQLYQAIVSRQVLIEIYNQTETFFPGPSPDMAVAIALALYAKKHYLVDAPVIIAGTSKRSAGGLGYKKKHEGDIRSVAQLPSDTADTWNSNVPFFWSGPTIYADSVLKSLARTGNSNLIKNFNFNYLYATLFVFNRNYKKTTKDTMKSNSSSSKISVLYYMLLLILLRSKFYFKNRISFVFASKNQKIYMPSLEEAVLHVENELKNINLPWGK